MFVYEKFQVNGVSLGDRLSLYDGEGNLIAIMNVESIWTPNKEKEALHVFGSTDLAHPAVFYLMKNAGEVYVGGSLQGVQLPVHYDFNHLRSM